jgi:glycosyltransferase involved in cell wall biosynthesis
MYERIEINSTPHELPLISVILPTLNAARTLGRCLDSISRQDYPRRMLEIVMADAGSTDGTLEIARNFGVDRIIPNPLRTGEAGKAVAIEASTGEILALVDSDNILEDPEYFSKAAEIFRDPSIFSAEPLGWILDPSDSIVNRYCALLGMNDPMSYFLGNYNRFSYLSGRFTGMKLLTVTDTPHALIVEVNPKAVPSFGANGFMVRRTAIEGLSWKPYYFDIDVFHEMAAAGRNRIAVMKAEIHHLYCDSISTFRRKQSRRIRDFFHHSKGKRRTYDYGKIPAWRFGWFILATLTIIPLIWQSLRGYIKKPDSAWFFHPLACWITLWEYGWGTLSSLGGTSEYNREEWKQ